MAFGEKKIPLAEIELQAPLVQTKLIDVAQKVVKREQDMG